MSLSGFVRKIKALEVLSNEQVEEIHKSILDTLENTGVRFEYDKALRIFGMNPQRFEKKEKTGTTMYYVNLREKGPIAQFRDTIGFRIPRKAALLNKVIEGFKDWKDLVDFCAATPFSWPFRNLAPEKVREILSLRESGLERKDTAEKSGVPQVSVDNVLTVIRQWGVIEKFDFIAPLGREKVEKALREHPYALGYVVGALKQKWSPKNKPKEIFARTKMPKYHDGLVKALESCFGEPSKVWMNGEYFNISLSDQGIVTGVDAMFGPFGEGVWDVDPAWINIHGKEFSKGVVEGILSSKNGSALSTDVTCCREEPVSHLSEFLYCADFTGHLYCSGDTQKIKYSLRIYIAHDRSEKCSILSLNSASS